MKVTPFQLQLAIKGLPDPKTHSENKQIVVIKDLFQRPDFKSTNPEQEKVYAIEIIFEKHYYKGEYYWVLEM